MQRGIIYAPFIMVQASENSRPEYDNFMKEYDLKHASCPKCGHHECTSTLVGYALDMDNKEDYKDLNKCVCQRCGNVHTMHDRKPMREGYFF